MNNTNEDFSTELAFSHEVVEEYPEDEIVTVEDVEDVAEEEVPMDEDDETNEEDVEGIDTVNEEDKEEEEGDEENVFAVFALDWYRNPIKPKAVVREESNEEENNTEHVILDLLDDEESPICVLPPPLVEELTTDVVLKIEEKVDDDSNPENFDNTNENPLVEIPLAYDGNEEEDDEPAEEKPFDEVRSDYGLIATGISILQNMNIMQPSIRLNEAFEDEPTDNDGYKPPSPLKNLLGMNFTPYKSHDDQKQNGTPETIESPTEANDVESQFRTPGLISELNQRFGMEDEIVTYGEDTLCNQKYLTILLVLLVITLMACLGGIVLVSKQEEITYGTPGKFFEVNAKDTSHHVILHDEDGQLSG